MHLLVLSFPASMDQANCEAAPQNWWMGGLVLPKIDKREKGRVGVQGGAEMERSVMLSFLYKIRNFI